jgi:hypothetical protein
MPAEDRLAAHVEELGDVARAEEGAHLPPAIVTLWPSLGSYYSVWLTMKDSDTVDEFYKYPGAELPEIGEVIKVVRFLRDRPTRARVTRVDTGFQFQPRIAATEIG